jgi:hypothetical protein
MATAPRPGVGARKEATTAAKTLLRLTLRGESFTLAPANLPLSERLIVRKATGGMPFETFWDGQESIGMDSFLVLWWLARRAAGESQLTLTRAEQEFPTDLAEGDVGLEEVTPDQEPDSPEA